MLLSLLANSAMISFDDLIGVTASAAVMFVCRSLKVKRQKFKYIKLTERLFKKKVSSKAHFASDALEPFDLFHHVVNY